LEDVRRVHGYQKVVPFRRQVAEILEEEPMEDASEFSDVEKGEEIEALALVCWNCRKEGHRYHDCEAKRKVFCYGCGHPNTYKPSCLKCQKNGKASTRPGHQSTVVGLVWSSGHK
ncbi:hypothetical protein KR018_009276, partial [Drosophila ironensis]